MSVERGYLVARITALETGKETLVKEVKRLQDVVAVAHFDKKAQAERITALEAECERLQKVAGALATDLREIHVDGQECGDDCPSCAVLARYDELASP